MFLKILKFYLKNWLMIILLSNLSYLLIGNRLNNVLHQIWKKYFFHYTLLKIIFVENLLLFLDYFLIFYLIIKTDDYNLNSELLKKHMTELKEYFSKNTFESIKEKNNDIVILNQKIKNMTRNSKYYKIKRTNYVACFIKLNNYYNVCFVFFWFSILFLMKEDLNNYIEEIIHNIFLIIILFQINNLKQIIKGIIYEIELKKFRICFLFFLDLLEIYFGINLLLKTILYNLEGLRNIFIYIFGIFIITILKNLTKFSVFNEILIIYIQIISKIN